VQVAAEAVATAAQREAAARVEEVRGQTLVQELLARQTVAVVAVVATQAVMVALVL
jgi:hypothetical protein